MFARGFIHVPSGRLDTVHSEAKGVPSETLCVYPTQCNPFIPWPHRASALYSLSHPVSGVPERPVFGASRRESSFGRAGSPAPTAFGLLTGPAACWQEMGKFSCPLSPAVEARGKPFHRHRDI